MIKAISISLLLATALAAPSTAADGQRQDVCSYYGNVGATTVDFLLPLKFSQVIDMLAGKDTVLLEKLSKALEGRGSVEVRNAIATMGEDALELMGEAAGSHSFQLVMTGQATNGQEVFGRLISDCMTTGPEAIVATQRRARAIQAGEQPAQQ